MRRNFLFILVFISICSISRAQIQPNLFKTVDKRAMDHWVDSIFDTMSTDEKIGQLFMVIADPSSSYHNRITQNIKDQKVGGVLFSGGTLENQVESINLYQKESRIPLFISFDGEWGLSMRLKETPRFPKNIMLGAIQDNQLIELYGEEVGRQFNEMGVHMNFAPMLDVYIYPNNPITNTRAYGESPELIAQKGISYSQGLEKKKVVAVSKHFPGHGGTIQDSHKTIPVINHNKTKLDSIDIYPFREYINKGLSGIMIGHLSIPALDNTPQLPSTLSPKIVTQLLKNDLGFEGLKVTDALVMIKDQKVKHGLAVEAILAGNDILLSILNPAKEFASVKKAVEMGIIPMENIEDKCLKILRYKYLVGLNNYRPTKLKGLKQKINSSYSDWLIQKLNAEAITLLKNEKGLIPINKMSEKKIALVALGGNKNNEFQQTMSFYNTFDCYLLNENEDPSSLFSRLKNYDAIVCSIHSSKFTDLAPLQSLVKQKEVHLCFFLAPSQVKKFKNSINFSKTVTLAYEDTQHANKAAAEILMGGLPAKGKLPVTIEGLFDSGTGIQTEKVRLSYQHPKEAGMSESILEKIDEVVKEGIEKQAFPGCQVLIAKDEIVVFNKAFGYFDYSNTHPVNPTDLYDLASVTKAIATVPAIMKLYDNGSLILQDKLSKYIPELENTDKENITIRMALFHETGLPSFYPFYQLLIDRNSYNGNLFSNKRDLTFHILYDKNVFMRSDFNFLPDMVSRSPQKGVNQQVAENFYINDNFNSIVLNKITELPLRKNENYLYSDLNFILLKEVVENISNEPFDFFLDKAFFNNLGCSTTTFLPLRKFDRDKIAPTEHDEFLRNQILIGYTHDETAAVLGGISGNAGLFSSANDLAKVLQMLLNQGKYGGEEYLSQTTTQLFTQTKSSKSRRGLGFDKPDKQKEIGSTSIQASGATYGHTGYAGTCFWVDPENNLIFIFLSNRVYPSRTYNQLSELKIRPKIHDIIYESIIYN